MDDADGRLRQAVRDADADGPFQAESTGWHRNAERAGLDVPGSGWIFSPMPDKSTWIKPDAVSQRYERMCARIGWDMSVHQLRQYAATELIAAGVDLRTVAGRLGHGGC